jgi:8-oxo-dGTP pyrophosphatase MutT (NUDIX family)
MPANKPEAWKKLSTTTLLEHPRMTVFEDEVELPNKKTSKYVYLVVAKDSVSAIAIKDGKMLVQQEYSYPPNKVMYQFPGGGVEPGEDLEKAVLRELQEESGYTGTPTLLGSYYPSNRRTANKMHAFLITDIEEVTKEGGDAEEFITSEWIPIATLRKMIANGEVDNFSILAGMALYDAKMNS